MSKTKTEPKIFVVSAPSGTGKTTLNRRLISEHDKVQMSISYTARLPRNGETDGVDYHFVTSERFRELIGQGQMLEYAEVFGTLYGTAIAEIHRIQEDGKIALLEIDVQGWRQAREKLANAKSIFILPPSVEVLWKRLENRGTETKDVRWHRLMTARNEISCGNMYDHFIINHDLETAYAELQSIIINGKNTKIGHKEGTAFCQRLLSEFDKSSWLQKLSRDLADQ